jgi:hypothetical protein
VKRIIRYAKDVMLRPKEFFKKVEHDKGIHKELQYLVVCSLVVFLFLTYHYIIKLNQYFAKLNEFVGVDTLPHIPETTQMFLLFYASLVFLTIALSFLRYWVTHWFVILFHGKHGYEHTYRAMVYTLTPEYLSAPLILITTIYSIFLQKTWWGYLILGVLASATLAIAIYQMYLRTIGLSSLQKISKLQAFLSIYVLGLIVQMMIILIVEVILMVTGYFIYTTIIS